MDLHNLPIQFGILLAAMAGTATYSAIRPYQKGWIVGMVSIASSIATGYVLTPGICTYWGWDTEPNYQAAVAYALGLLGMTCMRGVVSFAESNAYQIISKGIRRMLGLPEEPNEGKK